MTHSLHRRGSREEMARDFVFIGMSAKGINDEGSQPNKKRFFEIVAKYHPVNTGDPTRGNQARLGLDELRDGATDRTLCQAVFRDSATVAAVLKELHEANLGMSVTVAGLFDEVDRCCGKAGLKVHTEEYSLGTWGRTDYLPKAREFEVATMCGHGMVPAPLVLHLAEEVKKGRQTAEQAAGKMTRLCTCGVFNTPRAAEIIAALAAQ